MRSPSFSRTLRKLAGPGIVVVTMLAGVFPANASFGAPEHLDAPGRSTTDAHQAAPRVAEGSSGPVVLFTDGRDLRGTTRAAHRTAGAWSDAVLFERSYPPSALASDGLGAVWAFEQDGTTLRTRTTNGDGVWSAGPVVNGAPFGAPAAIAGGAGRIALAWGSTACVIIATAGAGAADAGAVGTGAVYPPPSPAKVVVVDTETSSVTGPVEVGSPDARAFGLAVDREGRVWLAGARDDVVEISVRDASGTWSSPSAAVAEPSGAVSLAALGTGEVLLAWLSPERALRAASRSPLTGAWSDPRLVAENAGAPQLVSGEAEALAPPLAGGAASAYWIGDGVLRRATYTSAIGGLLGEWSPASDIAHDATEFHTTPARIVYGVHRDAKSDVYTALPDGSGAERVHDDTPAAASKWPELLAPRGDSFEAIWADDESRDGMTLRRATFPSGASATDTGLPSGATLALAPDGSLLRASGGENAVVATVHDETHAVTRSASLPAGDFRAAVLGHGSFVVVSAIWNKGFVYRTYAQGAWSPARRVRLAAWDSFVLEQAGNGAAWLAWSVSDRPAPVDDALTPAPATTYSYAVSGVPLSVSGAGAKQRIGTGRSLHGPSLTGSGDGDGGIALAWEEHDGERGRTVFATSRDGAARLSTPEGVYGAAIAADGAGNAVVLWSGSGKLASAARAGGGAFVPLPDVPYDNGFPEGGASPYPCILDTVIALPPTPQPLMDAAGTAHLVFASGNEVRYSSLASGAASWSASSVIGTNTMHERVVSALGSTGTVAAVWATGDYPNRRMIGTAGPD